MAIQLEDEWLPPTTLESYRTIKNMRTNAAVLASDVYNAFEWREETLVVALDLEDAYSRVAFEILIRTMIT